MRTKSVLLMLALAAVTTSFRGGNEAMSAVSLQVGSPNLSFSISDYQPPPPNVYVHNDNGRPYYIERDRRVYMEKKHHGKKHKKEKHREDNDDHGHDKRGKHGR